MKKVLLKRLSGKVSIMYLEDHLDLNEEISKISETFQGDDIVNHREISDSDIPSSREFRDAWVDELSTSGIDIDLVKVKEIQLERLRVQRDVELAKTDSDFIIALSKNDTDALEQINSKKQQLRDATENLKNLQVSGYNDESVINNIKLLGTL